ncbi:MAG: hypothetical protein Q9160_003435 [Pyrenula sp. 1 TL-2023]
MEFLGEPSPIKESLHDSGHDRNEKQAEQPPISHQQSTTNASLLGDNSSKAESSLDAYDLPPDEAAPFPQLSHNPPTSPEPTGKKKGLEDSDEEEPHTAKSFDRATSPHSAFERNRGAVYEKVGEGGVSRMHKFTLYETSTWYYIVGSDLLDVRHRILKIDRNVEPGALSISGDDIVYTKKEVKQTLNSIDDGNKSSGGLKLKCSTWGLLGFIRFTGAYYMLFITKRSQVAMIGGHYIYQINGTQLIPLTATRKTEKNPDEARYINILNNLDLSRSFYFSYSYDITRTLQHNITQERKATQEGNAVPPQHDFNDMFVWNHHLLGPAEAAFKNVYDWCLPIIHGYVDQSALSIYWGRVVYITIIARRSRFFAGARFLKRGANDLGYVANDVETEQIVSEMLTTSFHGPGPSLYANPNLTSYVQHRGSIPLYWTQDSTGVSPKPAIEMNLVDPFYGAAALHFDNLFKRYGAPIYVLNLVKARERTPRESKLLKEFTDAISYLNQFLPEDKQILYKAWDMSRASKSRDQDVIGTLESIAEEIIPKTGFFKNGHDAESGLKLQNGVARTNCIDCLDRTNAAQFVIGKRALGHQLHALGVLNSTSVEYDSDAINLFTHMWHDHGDTIAVQYGGSHLVNTMATYRKINQWTSHSRDMVESFKRYYNNSFMDAQRQEAYNLFLGNYVFVQGQPMLWDLSTDYYLHHTDPRAWHERRRPEYINWFTPEYLQPVQVPPQATPAALTNTPLRYFDDYWVEYYRPRFISQFNKIFAYNVHSNIRYIPLKSTSEGRYDLSPFKVRTNSVDQSDTLQPPSKPDNRKGVKILEPPTEPSDAASALSSTTKRLASRPNHTHGIIKDPSFEVPTISATNIPPTKTSLTTNNNTLLTPATTTTTPSTKADATVDAFTRMVARSLDPTVPDAEEYQRYVTHPLQLPLVVSSSTTAPPGKANKEYIEYLRQGDGEGGGGGVEDRARQSEDVYREFLESGSREEGLTVLEEDAAKKRYKRYRQWVRGKSLFKQRPEV